MTGSGGGATSWGCGAKPLLPEARGSGGEATSVGQFLNKNNAFLSIFRPK